MGVELGGICNTPEKIKTECKILAQNVERKKKPLGETKDFMERQCCKSC